MLAVERDVIQLDWADAFHSNQICDRRSSSLKLISTRLRNGNGRWSRPRWAAAGCWRQPAPISNMLEKPPYQESGRAIKTRLRVS